MVECFIERDYAQKNVFERVKVFERKCLWAMQVKPAPYHTFSQMATPKILQSH